MAEVELNYTNLTEMQDTLLAKINTDMDPKDAEATLKMFDSVNKALAEERKAANEAYRIEAELQKAQMDADAQEKRSKRELIGNALRAAGQVGAAGIAGVVSVVTVGRILYAEGNDRLCLSKAISFVLKPRG